ncbi:MAG: hypothetical protein ACRCV9_16390 [Burkholderiaceae bacterium]
MIVFGNGAAWGTAKTDINGNALATPTPVRFAVIQELGVDISREMKVLHGERSFPVAVGVGKGKISMKGKFGNFSAAMFGQLYAGRAAATAATLIQSDDAFVAAASVTVTPPSSGTFVSDFGIADVATGNPFVRVASAPAVGQYSVTAGGVYTFNATDAGKALLRNYSYTIAAAAGRSTYSLSNDVMGLAPTFSYSGQTTFQGKRLVLTLNNCISSKFNLPQKNDDFATPDFEFEAFDNGTGTLGTLMIEEPS